MPVVKGTEFAGAHTRARCYYGVFWVFFLFFIFLCSVTAGDFTTERLLYHVSLIA